MPREDGNQDVGMLLLSSYCIIVSYNVRIIMLLPHSRGFEVGTLLPVVDQRCRNVRVDQYSNHSNLAPVSKMAPPSFTGLVSIEWKVGVEALVAL